MSDVIGLVRDVVAATLGVAILFGVNWSDEQVAGILLVVTTAGALASHLYSRFAAGDGTAAGESL